MQLAALVLMLAQAAPAAAPAATTPPQSAPAGPLVALDVVQAGTPLGTITIALDAEKAPITVDELPRSTSAPSTTTGRCSTA